MNQPIPETIIYDEAQNALKLQFPADNFVLPSEFLRVHSPSAEVRGHGAGQEVLQTGKRHVCIVGLEVVGHYALKIIFSDGHDSGLFTWAYLQQLGKQQSELWQAYLAKLDAAGASRDVETPTPPNRLCPAKAP